MKGKVVRYLIFTGTAVLLLLAAWICVTVLRVPKYVRPDTSGWHTGDVFFSVGDSWKSVAVRSISGAKGLNLTDLTPSHCGIVVVDSGVVKLVHESTSARRIVIETPDEYIRVNGSYCIYGRIPRCVPDSVRLVHVVDSLMNGGIPFDFEFDHTDDRSLYCTEMVVMVMELSGCSGLSGLRELGYIYPQDLLKMTDSIR